MRIASLAIVLGVVLAPIAPGGEQRASEDTRHSAQRGFAFTCDVLEAFARKTPVVVRGAYNPLRYEDGSLRFKARVDDDTPVVTVSGFKAHNIQACDHQRGGLRIELDVEVGADVFAATKLVNSLAEMIGQQREVLKTHDLPSEEVAGEDAVRFRLVFDAHLPLRTGAQQAGGSDSPEQYIRSIAARDGVELGQVTIERRRVADGASAYRVRPRGHELELMAIFNFMYFTSTGDAPFAATALSLEASEKDSDKWSFEVELTELR